VLTAELPSVWARLGRVVLVPNIRGLGWVKSVGYWVGSGWGKKFGPMYISEAY